MAQSIVIIEAHVDGPAPADLAARVAVPAAKARDELAALAKFFGALGKDNAELRVRVDSAAGVAAALTVNVTGANIADAEWIGFTTASGQSFKVTAQAGAATAGDGFFQSSATDNTVATNIRAAFNTLPGFDRVAAVTGATNALIFTATKAGAGGNTLRVVDGTANGLSTSGLLTGGIDPTSPVTAVVVCDFDSADADDTVTIGAVVLTAKTSGATGDDQFNLGADDDELAENLAECINEHPTLAGLMTAAVDDDTITITYQCDPRAALQIVWLTSDAGGFAITQPASTLTLTNAQATRTYALGAA